MKPTINEVPMNSVTKRLAELTTKHLQEINQRITKQDEEIQKLKHRIRKLEKKNV